MGTRNGSDEERRELERRVAAGDEDAVLELARFLEAQDGQAGRLHAGVRALSKLAVAEVESQGPHGSNVQRRLIRVPDFVREAIELSISPETESRWRGRTYGAGSVVVWKRLRDPGEPDDSDDAYDDAVASAVRVTSVAFRSSAYPEDAEDGKVGRVSVVLESGTPREHPLRLVRVRDASLDRVHLAYLDFARQPRPRIERWPESFVDAWETRREFSVPIHVAERWFVLVDAGDFSTRRNEGTDEDERDLARRSEAGDEEAAVELVRARLDRGALEPWQVAIADLPFLDAAFPESRESFTPGRLFMFVPDDRMLEVGLVYGSFALEAVLAKARRSLLEGLRKRHEDWSAYRALRLVQRYLAAGLRADDGLRSEMAELVAELEGRGSAYSRVTVPSLARDASLSLLQVAAAACGAVDGAAVTLRTVEDALASIQQLAEDLGVREEQHGLPFADWLLGFKVPRPRQRRARRWNGADEHRRDLARRAAAGDEEARHELDLVEEADDGAADDLERSFVEALGERVGRASMASPAPNRILGRPHQSYLERALGEIESLVLGNMGIDGRVRVEHLAGNPDWVHSVLENTPYVRDDVLVVLARHGDRWLVEFEREGAEIGWFDVRRRFWDDVENRSLMSRTEDKGRVLAHGDVFRRWARLRASRRTGS